MPSRRTPDPALLAAMQVGAAIGTAERALCDLAALDPRAALESARRVAQSTADLRAAVEAAAIRAALARARGVTRAAARLLGVTRGWLDAALRREHRALASLARHVPGRVPGVTEAPDL